MKIEYLINFKQYNCYMHYVWVLKTLYLPNVCDITVISYKYLLNQKNKNNKTNKC